MVSVGRHKNITLLTYSEVKEVAGVIGDFRVRVRKKARYVDEEACTGCGTCVEKCPWKRIPDAFELGWGQRPAIYFHFAQTVPKIPVIDRENCTYFKNGKCQACAKFCPKEAIVFDQEDEIVELEVGTIILATGFRDFDPRRSPQYGYGELDNVLTGMEFERLVNSGGPTSGTVHLRNGDKPARIAIIHCVGSRGDQNAHCSRVCCMYSLKLAHLARDVIGADVVEFYRDMRTFGKGYEAFFDRVAREGVEFVRYDDHIDVTRRNGSLCVRTTDLYSGERKAAAVDMVVLSSGMEPQSDQADVASTFGISLGADGFFLEKHPKLAPVETATEGVFLAGACQSPKDIPDSVAQGGAAAAAALALMDARSVALEPFTAHVDSDRCSACRVCAGVCPYGAISIVEENGRAFSQVTEVLCKGCGACAAACPSGIITQKGFTDAQIMAELEGALAVFLPRQEAHYESIEA
jgi:heterodisulfide reductase subunit A